MDQIDELVLEENTNQDILITQTKSFINPLFEYIQKKFKKHEKQSEFILTNVMTPFEAIKEGAEKAIASYIKMGNEGLVTQKLVLGPQPKTKETNQAELLVKQLLKDFNSIKFIKIDNVYLAISTDNIYNFSKILERVDFNQITLTNEELLNYHALLNSDNICNKPFLNNILRRPTRQDFIDLDPENLCSSLTFPEKEAINIYTSSYYYVMNSLMRGNIDEAVEGDYSCFDSCSKEEQANRTLKEAFLHIAVAVSALNKLPDFVPPLGTDGECQKYLYRSESNLPNSILDQRKRAILEGGKVTREMGFLSTAFSKPAAGFFSEFTRSTIMLKGLKGKKITPLSQFGEVEREVLIPPTQVQWLYCKDIVTDVYKNTMTLFIAKPVNTPFNISTLEDQDKKEAWLLAQNKDLLHGSSKAMMA